MHTPTASIKNIAITESRSIRLYVPDPVSVKNLYKQDQRTFPYWSQIWPAALGLCTFLEKHTGLLQNKTVLELAAGLGLPSLLAAGYCRSVTMSDYLPEPVELMRSSIILNQLSNAKASILNWNDLPETIGAEVVLLSDINYEPEVFETVFTVIRRFISDGATIILSTPQRLMAKPFIERLLVYCKLQEEIIVHSNNELIPITLLVLTSDQISID
ncbi:protein N-lysine methyltransferase family protein [Terrimonas sp. NA20]|uniref:Protein N-lysine methyltransferase family protein n=1 Tax=Terrimonas ginsenosidimutans TaxID=2908004 RepID=A0ABS9KX24_9BACT|nr:protein N-lysine methyltransferase family protein [Terrimonas ginsenosidimutans]MCG2616896.1 protein N-lysine methyltransferase family protein [Terrimonas ginsenosidimutans]